MFASLRWDTARAVRGKDSRDLATMARAVVEDLGRKTWGETGGGKDGDDGGALFSAAAAAEAS